MKALALLCLVCSFSVCIDAQAFIRFHNAYTATNSVGLTLNTDATFLPVLGQKQSTQYIPMCTGVDFTYVLTGLPDGAPAVSGFIAALNEGEVLDVLIRGAEGASDPNDEPSVYQVRVTSQATAPEFLQDVPGNQAAVRVINGMLSSGSFSVDVSTSADEFIGISVDPQSGSVAVQGSAGYAFVTPNTDVIAKRTGSSSIPVTPKSGEADDLVGNRHYTVIIFGLNDGNGGEAPMARIVHDSYPVAVGSPDDRNSDWSNLRVAHLDRDRSGSQVQIAVRVNNTNAVGHKASCTWTAYANDKAMLYTTDVDEPIAPGRTLVRSVNNAVYAHESGVKTISLFADEQFVGAAGFGAASAYANVTSGMYTVTVAAGDGEPAGDTMALVTGVRVQSGQGMSVFSYGGSPTTVDTVLVEDLARFNGSYCPQAVPTPTTPSPTRGSPPTTSAPTLSPTTGTPVTPAPTGTPVTASPTFALEPQAFVVAPFAPYGYVSHAIRIPKTAQLTIEYASINARGVLSASEVYTYDCFTPLPTSAPTTGTPTTAPTTASPTTASPTTTSPSTASPTATTASPTTTTGTCSSGDAFVPPGAACVNGVYITSTNTTVPPGAPAIVSTSVTVTGGASFAQPSGSTLVFVASGSAASEQSSSSIIVEGGGCATIDGDAVVNFEEDPSAGGVQGTTGALVLVTANCVLGQFRTVTATTSFEGDECVAVGDGEQQASGNSISVSFGVSNTCDKNSTGLSIGVLVAIIVGAVVVVSVIVVVVVKVGVRARERRSHEDVKMSHRKV